MLKAIKKLQAGGRELQDRADFFYNENGLIAVLADGAGGMSGAAEAAEFVVNHVRKAAAANTLNVDGLRDFLISVDQQMAADKTSGETTCVIVALSNGRIVGTSAGDSGALMISDSDIDDLTSHQCRKPFVGSGCALPVPFERPHLQGTLLIASDGLLKYTSREQIAKAARITDIELAAEKLLELVRYPSGAWPDDISVILVRDR